MCRALNYFDPNAFTPVTAVRFGKSGRNILRGPGLVSVDAGLFRFFPIIDRVQLQFRAPRATQMAENCAA